MLRVRSKRLRVMKTENLSGDAPVELFAASLRQALPQVDPLFQAELNGHHMSGSFALSLSKSEFTPGAFSGLPRLFRLDAGVGYFAYQLYTGIAADGGAIHVYASLQRGSRILGVWSFCRQPTVSAGAALPTKVDCADIAFAARQVAFLTAGTLADRKFSLAAQYAA